MWLCFRGWGVVKDLCVVVFRAGGVVQRTCVGCVFELGLCV